MVAGFLLKQLPQDLSHASRRNVDRGLFITFADANDGIEVSGPSSLRKFWSPSVETVAMTAAPTSGASEIILVGV
jgi:hypothetical protein